MKKLKKKKPFDPFSRDNAPRKLTKEDLVILNRPPKGRVPMFKVDIEE